MLMIASGHNSVAAILATGAMYYTNYHASSEYDPALWFTLVILGLISHYLADAIPHGHYKKPESALKTYVTKPKAERTHIPLSTFFIGLVDMLVSLLIFVVLFWLLFGAGSLIILFFAFIGAQLPDLVMLIHDSGIAPNNPLVKLEQSLHAGPVHWHDSESDLPRPWGITDIWQIGVFILAIILCVQYYFFIS